MARQAVPLQPTEVNGGADLHLQPVEDPMPEQLFTIRVCSSKLHLTLHPEQSGSMDGVQKRDQLLVCDQLIRKGVDFMEPLFMFRVMEFSCSGLQINQIIGRDEVHPRVLREVTNVIARPLFIIFEWSKQSGQICDNWKKANVMPFVKKGKKEDLGNCKSHLVPGKVVEQMLLKAASRHVKDSKVTEQSAWTDQRQIVPSTVRQLTL
ncbi:hypothetical protein QYF61_015418 [Mycteria americana]|uniref:Uncharacterized protein n=1 Tax=Mycteria americana TaxID=33587 RepID=A0AAN7PIJ3_MYCAM|nr:hypothetical protein QYF61_015418 [Mycteria americana]